MSSDIALSVLRKQLDRECEGTVIFPSDDASVMVTCCTKHEVADLERVCLNLEPLLLERGATIPSNGKRADGRLLTWARSQLRLDGGANYREMVNPFSSLGLAIDLFLKEEQETQGEPCQRLFGWPEILTKIGRPNTEEEKRRIGLLNRKLNGPIQTRDSAPPTCVVAKLLAWWNNLERRYDEKEAERRNREGTVKEEYKHGRGNAAVLPAISGHVKQRRKTT